MRNTLKKLAYCLIAVGLSLPAGAVVKKIAPAPAQSRLWRDPGNIASRDLFYGAGGKAHQPRGAFRFIKEDLKGSNPKFIIDDESGVKWKVKLGQEARSETAASRLVWAVGYITDEDYLLPVLRVGDMPAKLHRGQDLVAPDGSILNARLKRHPNDEEKVGSWEWRNAPFTGTREFNGLRVMMALINNWDLKDVNTAIYAEKGSPEDSPQHYAVTDLGATFGTAGYGWPTLKAKDRLRSYSKSKFIIHLTPEYVDFQTPARSALVRAVAAPQFIGRLRMRWIGRHIPRADARWMGQMLARLSENQIRDAFRAAGYSPAEVAGFTSVVRQRIAELNQL